MDNSNPARVAAGVPTGGQFAVMDRAEADVNLTGDPKAVTASLEPTIEHGIVKIALPDGSAREFPATYLPFVPDDAIDPAADLLADGTVRLHYATLDTDPYEHEFSEGVTFREFRFEQDRDDFIREQESALGPDAEVFIVDHYEHGGSIFRLLGKLGEDIRTGDRWDSRPSCVIVVPAGENGFTDPREAARAELAQYNEFCNGETYVLEVVDIDPNGDMEHVSSVHGYIGQDNTQSIVNAKEL